jgi:hypothetical protein
MAKIIDSSRISICNDGGIVLDDADLVALEHDFTLAPLAGGSNSGCSNSKCGSGSNDGCQNGGCNDGSSNSSCVNIACTGLSHQDF